MVISLLWFFVPLIFLLGIVTSYTDIRYGKIFNKHLLWALGILIVIYIVILIGPWSLGEDYFFNFGMNLVIAFAIGFLFWHLGLWSAADSKLFTVYAALVPLIVYSRTYYSLFPSLTLLINSFVPFFVGFSLKAFFTASINRKRKFFSNVRLKDVLALVMLIFVMMWIPSLVFKIFHTRLIFIISLAIMFGLAFVLKKLFEENLVFVMIGLTIVRIIFDYAYVSTFGFLKQFSYLSILIVVIYVLINSGSQFFVKKINIKKIRPGMILAGKVYDGKKEIKLEHPAEGLTMKDVRKILRLYKNKKVGDSVNIYQTIPFAPFMFAGALLTIVLRGDFLISLVKLLT